MNNTILNKIVNGASMALLMIGVASCSDVDVADMTVNNSSLELQAASDTVPNFDYREHTNTITVTSNTRWTASLAVEDNWISLIDSEGRSTTLISGTGNGTFTYSLRLNQSQTPRTATIKVVSRESGLTAQEIVIDQNATTITLDPLSIAANVAAGEASVNVMSNNAWEAIGEEGVTATPSSGEAGVTPVTIKYSQNMTNTTRVLRVVFKHSDGEEATLIVNQDGASFKITNTDHTLEPVNGGSEFDIRSDEAWQVSVASDGDWLKLNDGVLEINGLGDKTIEMMADDNDATVARTATVTVKSASSSQSFTVFQKAGPINIQTTNVSVVYREYSTATVTYIYVPTPDSKIEERGVVWSKTKNPTLESGTHLADASSDTTLGVTNSYSIEMRGLESSTTYYARGYVTVSFGDITKVYYGVQNEFVTKTVPGSDDVSTPDNP